AADRAGDIEALLEWVALGPRVDARPAGPDPDRRARWLARDPKATVYIDLPDFTFWRIEPVSGLLNAGFGQAFSLTAADMLKPPAE
ncbi:MAG TPA: hypothetical protein PLI13_10740, partial [Paracoccus sp. (in: a-proteobacteria)]|nr:hypothetical protein [Paracoccus sp. (in: a-proteobacteria)]